MSIELTEGDWNKEQTFDAGGRIFLIASMSAGGFIVGRIDEAEPSKMTVVAADLATVDEAVAAAKRLKKGALN